MDIDMCKCPGRLSAESAFVSQVTYANADSVLGIGLAT
jgi:hypothetical protein